MRFLTAAYTDIGIKKKVNQDAFCLFTASAGAQNIAFGVVCDGMGGLKMGELASSFLINAFVDWFERVFPEEIKTGYDAERITAEWSEIIRSQNELIMSYGKEQGVLMGTTVTAVLLYGSDYIAIHVGDSRLYRLNKAIEQVTEDHSLVALEVKQGKITAEQAKTDSRGNILLQCVGASQTVTPQVVTGQAQNNDVFLICSDGFRHLISEEEIFGVLAPELLTDEQIMRTSIIDLININKSRGEADNITSVLIKCIG